MNFLTPICLFFSEEKLKQFLSYEDDNEHANLDKYPLKNVI